MTTRLDDVKARLAAATPGPWKWDRSRENDSWGDCGPHLESMETEHKTYTRHDGTVIHGSIPKHQIVTASGYDASSISVEDADAALIANAPTDLAALVTLVETLEHDLSERARILRTSATRLNDEVLSRHPDRDPDSARRYDAYATEAEQILRIVRERING